MKNGRRPPKFKKREDNLKEKRKKKRRPHISYILFLYFLDLGANLSWGWLSSLRFNQNGLGIKGLLVDIFKSIYWKVKFFNLMNKT
jgi:hypothetical protein